MQPNTKAGLQGLLLANIVTNLLTHPWYFSDLTQLDFYMFQNDKRTTIEEFGGDCHVSGVETN